MKIYLLTIECEIQGAFSTLNKAKEEAKKLLGPVPEISFTEGPLYTLVNEDIGNGLVTDLGAIEEIDYTS